MLGKFARVGTGVGEAIGATEELAPEISTALLQNSEGSSSLDLNAIKTAMFAIPADGNVDYIKKQVGKLIIDEAGTSSKRLKFFYGFSYLMMASNGYPVFPKEDRFVLLYSYMMLFATTLLYIRIARYSDSITKGCKKLKDTHTLFDEHLKEAFKYGFITRKFEGGVATFETKEEIATITYITARTWKLVETKHGYRLEHFNNFRVVELSIHMMSAMLNILISFKRNNPKARVVLHQDFIESVSQSFFTILDTLLYRSPWSIFKMQNPFKHVSFHDPAPQMKQFVLAGIGVLQRNTRLVHLEDEAGVLRDVVLNPIDPESLQNVSFIDRSVAHAAASIHARTIIGLPITTEVSNNAQAQRLDRLLTGMCRAVNNSYGTDNWGIDIIYKVLRNGFVHFPIALSLYSKEWYEFSNSWIWIISGSATYLCDYRREKNHSTECRVKESYAHFIDCIATLGEKGLIRFQQDGNASSTQALEDIKFITSSAVGHALKIGTSDELKLSRTDLGYLMSTIFYFVASEFMAATNTSIEVPRGNIQRTVIALGDKLADKLSSNRFTSFLRCGMKEATLRGSLSEPEFRSVINTTLAIATVNLKEKCNESPKSVLSNLQASTQEKSAHRRRSKKREALCAADPDVDAERSYHSAGSRE